jgi:hypothetical protein
MKECTVGIQMYEGGMVATREWYGEGQVKIFTNINKAIAWIKEPLIKTVENQLENVVSEK